MEPIYKFKDESELIKRGRYWQNKLELNDWYIKYELTNDLNVKYATGENQYMFIQKQSIIRILKDYDPAEELPFVQPQEQALIHELLHCKFLSYDYDNYEEKVLDDYNHQLLEEMSKVIFMCEYGLDKNCYLKENK